MIQTKRICDMGIRDMGKETCAQRWWFQPGISMIGRQLVKQECARSGFQARHPGSREEHESRPPVQMPHLAAAPVPVAAMEAGADPGIRTRQG